MALAELAVDIAGELEDGVKAAEGFGDVVELEKLLP